MNDAQEIVRLRAELKTAKRERDDADRRAGAAERQNSYLQDSENAREMWLREAKETLGYDRNISFDVVWADLLKERHEMRQMLEICTVASCTCLTKTNEVKFHAEDCRYRRIKELLTKHRVIS